jgi:hypothetical protein
MWKQKLENKIPSMEGLYIFFSIPCIVDNLCLNLANILILFWRDDEENLKNIIH